MMSYFEISLNNLKAVFLFLSVVMLTTSPFSINEAFGQHLSEEIKWQVVVISSYPACSNYHFQVMNKYSEITEQYLDSYELGNSKYSPLCFPESKYIEYSSPLDLDLIILVYDKDLGENELHSQKIGGFYHHFGKDRSLNHAIVFCDCPNFKYSDPVWILSHELSHFVLTYLEYDMYVIEDLVHANDYKYDQCIKHWDDSCSSVVTKLRSDTSAYSYSVMPLYEPAIGGIAISEIYEVPIAVVELNKIITKWWTQGKITEGDYSNALGFMATGNLLYSHTNSEILTADNSFDDELTWDELLSTENEKDEYDILSRIPHSMNSIEEKIFGDDDVSGIPHWFKETAKWWVEGKISNQEFQKSVEFLRDQGILRPR